MAAVDEKQLWRSILCILSILLLPNLGQVPDVQPAVCAGTRKDGLVVGRPLYLGTWKMKQIDLWTLTYLEDLILVRFKGVQLQLEIPKVPEGNLSKEDEPEKS